jgi:hypothetical protein
VCIGNTGADYPLQFPNGGLLRPNGAFEFGKGLPFLAITDGLSGTIMVGEKHVPEFSFLLYPYDCSIYDGHNPICNTRCGGPNFPLAYSRKQDIWSFGSYHPDICQFVFCDGSVRWLDNTISPVTLGWLAQRNDGEVPTDY